MRKKGTKRRKEKRDEEKGGKKGTKRREGKRD